MTITMNLLKKFGIPMFAGALLLTARPVTSASQAIGLEPIEQPVRTTEAVLPKIFHHWPTVTVAAVDPKIFHHWPTMTVTSVDPKIFHHWG